MARTDSDGNRSKAPRPKTERFSDVVFISFPLTKEQTDAIKSFVWTLEDFDHNLLQLNEAKYKVSFSWDDYSDAFACFITPVGDKHSNKGFILTGRGSSPWKALRQAAYVHYVLFEGDWSGWRDTRRGVEIDD